MLNNAISQFNAELNYSFAEDSAPVVLESMAKLAELRGRPAMAKELRILAYSKSQPVDDMEVNHER